MNCRFYWLILILILGSIATGGLYGTTRTRSHAGTEAHGNRTRRIPHRHI